MRFGGVTAGAAVLLVLSGLMQPGMAQRAAAQPRVQADASLSPDDHHGSSTHTVAFALFHSGTEGGAASAAESGNAGIRSAPRAEPEVARPDQELSLVSGDRFLEDGIRVMASDGKQLWAVAADGKTLCTSVDDGITWTPRVTMPKTVQTINITPRGVMLVSISSNFWTAQPDAEIFRSTDGGQSFASVLTVKTGHVYHWNIAADKDGYIFVSEYGYKGEADNARRIYRSADDGVTWKVVYEPAPTEGHHDHKILVDSQNPRIIYQSVGDGPNSQILKSIDRGDSWQVVSTGYNPTSAVQLGDHILWGLDNTPFPGMISQSKADNTVRPVFTPPQPYAGSIYDILSADGVLYAGFLSYDWPSQTWNGTIFVSRDKGASWTKWAEWPKVQDEGIGFYHFVRQGPYGYVDVTLPTRSGTEVVTYRGTVRFPLLRPSRADLLKTR